MLTLFLSQEDLKMSLHCLVYTSLSRQKLSDDNIKYFLQLIRHKNEIEQVTGMLVYLDPFFIQVLEGEETTVNRLFDIIKNDPRHYKVSLIYKKPIAERHFSNWTMGFSKISYKDIEMLDGFSDFLQKPSIEFFNRSPNEVDELLYKFKHEILF
ncbi:MAG: BLUF domain-containing protein [Methylococcales bacterium]